MTKSVGIVCDQGCRLVVEHLVSMGNGLDLIFNSKGKVYFRHLVIKFYNTSLFSSFIQWKLTLFLIMVHLLGAPFPTTIYEQKFIYCQVSDLPGEGHVHESVTALTFSVYLLSTYLSSLYYQVSLSFLRETYPQSQIILILFCFYLCPGFC